MPYGQHSTFDPRLLAIKGLGGTILQPSGVNNTDPPKCKTKLDHTTCRMVDAIQRTFGPPLLAVEDLDGVMPQPKGVNDINPPKTREW